jgi:magnesium chelatase family protein
MQVAAVPFRDLSEESGGAGSKEMRLQVFRARQKQERRFAGTRIFANAHMTPRMIKESCVLGVEPRRLLETAVERFGLSARGYSRILKIARTIADLEGVDNLTLPHVAEAIQYRTLDRQFTSEKGVMFLKEISQPYSTKG